MLRPAVMLIAALWLVATLAPSVSAQQSAFQPVATRLAFPTDLAFARDGRIFFTEKETGNVRIIRNGRLLPAPFVHLSVEGSAERGLLGIALDPGFPRQPWVYLYFSDAAAGINRVVRVRAEGDRGTDVQQVIPLLPDVSGYHNGGDMAFGPDGKLYVVTGEAHDASRAQDPSDLGGKVLRLNPDGSTPAGGPFGSGSPVYALGIRNSFGLCFDPVTGDLWETENGPSSDDEVNRIQAGANYGWPVQLGPGGGPRYTDPVLDFRRVVVPTGCAVTSDGRWMYFGSFDNGVYRAPIRQGGTSLGTPELLSGVGGSVTDVARSPDGTIYVATADSILRLSGSPSGSPVPSAVSSARSSRGIGTTVGLVIAAILLVALILLRRRIPGPNRPGA